MNPENPAPDKLPQPTAPVSGYSQAYSVDYLNQIAVKPPRKMMNRFAVIGLILGFIVMIIVAPALINSGGPSVSTRTTNVYLRLQTLQTVTSAEEAHLTENAINSTNASLSTSLISMTTDFTSIMKARGLKLPATNDKLAVAETAYQKSLSAKLDNAYLAGTLDRAYANEMAYQLSLLKSQLQQLKAAAHSKSIDSFYDKNMPTIDDYVTQLSDFTASK